MLGQLTIRERPGKTTFRFWQEGSGYDRNSYNVEAIKAVIDYIHHNPVRRGLCEHPAAWKWSSYRLYETPAEPPEPELPQLRRFCL